MAKELKRSSDKKVAGIIGGLADYMDIDHTMARIIFASLTLLSGIVGGLAYIVGGLAFYVICLVLMKE